jgi:hypothetical protein
MALERTTKVKLNELVYRYLKSTDESFVPQDSRRLLGATTACGA